MHLRTSRRNGCNISVPRQDAIRRQRRTMLMRAVPVLSAALIARASDADVIDSRRLALLGDVAPDTAGLTFSAFGLDLGNNPGISINSAGRVSFAARLAGAGVVLNSNDFAFFAGSNPADTRMVLRRGDQPIGAEPGVVFGIPNSNPSISFSEPLLNSSGLVAIRSDVRGANVTTANEEGIWAGGDASTLALLVRRGQSVPGASTTFIDLDGLTRVSTSGFHFQATLASRTFNNTSDTGVFHVSPAGVITTVARTGISIEGSQIAALDSGGLGFSVNGAGHFTGRGTTTVGAGMSDLDGDARINTLFYAIPLTPGGVLTYNLMTVAREGDAAFGADGARFGSFISAPSINDVGQAVFTAMLASGTSGAPVVTSGPDANHLAVYRSVGTSTALVARANDAISDQPGMEIATFTGPSGAANDGSVLLQITPRTTAGVVQSNLEALYLTVGQQTPGIFAGTRVVQEGVAIGRLFTNTGSVSSLAQSTTHFSIDDRAVNSNAQVLYRTDLAGGSGIDSSNNTGIYLYDARLNQTEILIREGDQIDINPDPLLSDLRTVLSGQIYSNFGFFKGGTDGDPAGFNDWAEVPVYLKLSGGAEGVFVLAPTPQWRADASGAWTSSGSNPASNTWTTRAPNGVGAVAKFGNAIRQARTITLDGNRTVGKLIFDGGFSYTLSGGSLTLDAGLANARIVIDNFAGAGTHNIGSPIVLKNPLEIASAAGTTLNLTGAFNNSLGHVITKSGPGAANLDGLQTNAPGVGYVVTGGALRIGSDPNLELSTLAVGGGGTLQFANPAATLTSRSLSALTGGGTLDLGPRNLFVTGAAGYAWHGALNIAGSGALNFARDAAAGGPVAVSPGSSITINGALLLSSSGDPFTSTTDPNVSAALVNNGVLSISGGAKRLAGLTGTGTTSISTATPLTIAGPLVQSSVSTNGNLSVAADSSVGATTLTPSGAVDLNVGAGATYLSTSSFNLGGSAVLNKLGAGQLRINNAATIPAVATLNINAGSLLYNAPQAIAATVTTNVNATGALGGRGTFAGHVTVHASGNLAPGDGIGTLTVNTLSLAGNNNVSVELGAAGSSGKLAVVANNGLNVLGPVVISPLYNDGFGTGTYTVIDYEGILNGSFANFSVAPSPVAGLSVTLAQGASSIDVVVSAIGDNQWKLSGGASYNSPSNFTHNFSPNAIGAIANFLSNLKTPSTVSVDSPVTLGRIVFDNDAAGYTLGQAVGAAAITLADPAGTHIGVGNGAHEVRAPLIISNDLTLGSGEYLTISGPVTTPAARTITSDGIVFISGPQTHADGSTFRVNSGSATFMTNPTANLNLIANGSVSLHADGALRDVTLGLASLWLHHPGMFTFRNFTANSVGSLGVSNPSASLTVSSVFSIAANSVLGKDGDGALNIGTQQHGANAMFTIGRGVVRFNASGGTNLTATAGGSTVELNGINFTASKLQLNGSSTLSALGASSLTNPLVVLNSNTVATPTASDSLALSGLTINSGGALTKTGAGVITLGGTQSYASGTRLNVNGGTLRYDGGSAANLAFWLNTPSASTALHLNNVPLTASSINFNGGTLLATGTTSTTARIAIKIDQSVADGVINTPGAADTLTLNGPLDFNFAGGEIQVTNTLRKTGLGTVIANGSQAYAGGRTTTYDIQQGVWRFNSGGGSSTRLDVAVASGATLAYGSSGSSNITHTLDELFANGGTVSVTGTTNLTSNDFLHDASTTLSTPNAGDTLVWKTLDATVGMRMLANTTLTKTGAGTVTADHVRYNFNANSKLQINGGTFRFLDSITSTNTGSTHKNLSINAASGSTLALTGTMNNSSITLAGATLLASGSPAVTTTLNTSGSTTLSTPAASDTLAISSTLNNSGTLLKTGPGTLTISGTQNHTGAPALNVNSGAVHLNSNAGGASQTRTLAVNVTGATTALHMNTTQHLASIAIAGARATLNGGNKLLAADTITLDAAATLDLNDNILVIRNGDYATLEQRVRNARNGGAWNLPGITSTTAASSPTHSVGIIANVSTTGTPIYTSYQGQNSLTTAAVLARYTLNGDSDLDGDLDADDYNRLDRGYLLRRTSWRWGDANHDGMVNLFDYALVDHAYSLTHPSGGAMMIAAHTAAFGEPYLLALQSVPEPGTGMLISIGGAGMLLRRRRARSA